MDRVVRISKCRRCETPPASRSLTGEMLACAIGIVRPRASPSRCPQIERGFGDHAESAVSADDRIEDVRMPASLASTTEPSDRRPSTISPGMMGPATYGRHVDGETPPTVKLA